MAPPVALTADAIPSTSGSIFTQSALSALEIRGRAAMGVRFLPLNGSAADLESRQGWGYSVDKLDVGSEKLAWSAEM